MIERPQPLAGVMQERDRDIFVRLAVPQRPCRRLQAMVIARDVVGGVVPEILEQGEQPAGKLAQALLMNVLKDFEILIRSLVQYAATVSARWPGR